MYAQFIILSIFYSIAVKGGRHVVVVTVQHIVAKATAVAAVYGAASVATAASDAVACFASGVGEYPFCLS